MRLRTTAVVFAGALALVLPTAGPSLADDHDGWGLGILHYQFLDEGGELTRGQIRPADNDTCYLLTGTSRDEPAIDVVNDTRSQAVLFDNRSCGGEPERVVEPGERERNLEAVAVVFRSSHEEGPGRGDWDGREEQGLGDQGLGDQGLGEQGRGEQGRGDQGQEDPGRGDGEGREDQAARPGNGAVEDGVGAPEAGGEDFLASVFRALG
ncbi:hypothetical protein OG765_11585 [Streptomyces sp. NBC_00555]|uniref:hypothetical protein n=1 Tax=Streptomyces sp. NBC_00555 TaxID=2903662 RepID=UPI00224F7EBE|nr:hypothetical protein [Streptomyces sp. NBC_00555]MCX5011625.1 hypothetical protein [Streptomyces sp. NBC_00555]